jgi:hypothetical protein
MSWMRCIATTIGPLGMGTTDFRSDARRRLVERAGPGGGVEPGEHAP